MAAFSSQVGAGSPQENAAEQNHGASLRISSEAKRLQEISKQETAREDRRKVMTGIGPSHIFGAVGFSMGALSM
jgi:hypothetical protein